MRKGVSRNRRFAYRTARGGGYFRIRDGPAQNIHRGGFVVQGRTAQKQESFLKKPLITLFGFFNVHYNFSES
jgi:hypothetical protein